MINFQKTQRYLRERDKYVKYNSLRAEFFIKALKIFSENPNHPSLNLEKLGGTNIWTIRINRADRIFFLWIDKETVLLIDVGTHDRYRQY